MYFRNDDIDPAQNLNEDITQDLNETRRSHSHHNHCEEHNENMCCPMMYCCPMMHGQQMMPYQTMSTQIDPSQMMPNITMPMNMDCKEKKKCGCSDGYRYDGHDHYSHDHYPYYQNYPYYPYYQYYPYYPYHHNYYHNR